MVRPVFIIGCPRSGTTIALDLVSAHEGFAWISQQLDRNPYKLELALLNRIYDDPTHGESLLLKRHRSAALPHPVEPWKFWQAYLSAFRWERSNENFPRRRDETDISRDETGAIRQVVDTVCNYQNKKLFLSKYTDFPRIKYLTQAFPEAIFVHIVRDGRAVAHSYLKEIQRGAWRTWEERDWWMQGWTNAWRREWLDNSPTPLGFVAYLWKFFVDQIWQDAQHISDDQYIEVNYRDFIRSPNVILNDLFEKIGIDMSSRVDRYTDSIHLANMNNKWRRDLSEEQQNVLEVITSESRFKPLLDD